VAPPEEVAPLEPPPPELPDAAGEPPDELLEPVPPPLLAAPGAPVPVAPPLLPPALASAPSDPSADWSGGDGFEPHATASAPTITGLPDAHRK